MNMRRLLFSALCCISLFGAAKEINPITKAMLDGYATLLAQDPNDYLTLYERASQYYRLDDYDRALSDVMKAISCTPAKEKDQIVSEYSLLADIYTQLGRYDDALTSVNKALDLDPESYALLYMKGNLCLHLSQPECARNAFAAMQRVNARSPEALFGLARVAVMEGDRGQAVRYLADVEKLDPGNYLTYCRIGDVHKELGMSREAASDYLSAFSLTDKSDRPVSSLIALAKEDYDAVEGAIDDALSHTGNVVPLYFLQGSAAKESGHYDDAYAAYRQLMANVSESDAQELSCTMAEVCLRRGDLAEADTYASRAMMTSPDLRANLVKGVIEQARGNHVSAGMYAQAALRLDRTSGDALGLAAQAAFASGDNVAALSFLNEAVMNDASDVDALLFRGYLQHNVLGDRAAGLNDFRRAASLDAEGHDGLTRKAIAQAMTGMSIDAADTMAPVRAASERDARAAYLSALYSLATGDVAEARSMCRKAVDLGFEDRYLLEYNEMPLLSVKTLNK